MGSIHKFNPEPAPPDAGEDDPVLARPLHEPWFGGIGRSDHMTIRTSSTARRRSAASEPSPTPWRSSRRCWCTSTMPTTARKRRTRTSPRTDGVVRFRVGNYTLRATSKRLRGHGRATTPTGRTTSTSTSRAVTTTRTRRSSAPHATGTGRASSTRSCATTCRRKQIAARYLVNKLWDFFAHPVARAT